MAILYTNSGIVLQRYVSGEPIITDHNANVIQSLHFLWQRNAETILAYYPRVAWTTTSATPTAIGDNDATPFTERLGLFPMMRDGWRPDVGGDTKLTATAIGGLVSAIFEVYSAGVLIDSVTASVGAGPLAIVSGTLTIPPGTVDAWLKVTGERNGASGTGELDALYVRSAYDSGAPK